MSEVFVVFSPISGIDFQAVDELQLGRARVFRNPLATVLSQSRDCEDIGPNVSIYPHDVIDGMPTPPFDADLRLHGIAKCLIELEIETTTNKLPAAVVSEQLKWAVLPLRILTPARVLTGSGFQGAVLLEGSGSFRGGGVLIGLASGGIKEEICSKSWLVSAPVASGIYVPIFEQVARMIEDFALAADRHRDTLRDRLRVPIDMFSASFTETSQANRAIILLQTLESLVCERGLKSGIRDKVASRTAALVFGDRSKRRETKCLLEVAMDNRKDVEHGRKSKDEVEEYFTGIVEQLAKLVRQALFEAVRSLVGGKELSPYFAGLQIVSANEGAP